MLRISLAFVVATLAILDPSVATAEVGRSRDEVAIVGKSMGGSARSKLESWLVPPAGSLVLGATFVFLTSDLTPGGEKIKFTDIAVLDPTVRYSLTDRLELFGSAGLLVKQGPDTDEPVFQTAALGARFGLGKRYAIFADVAGGNLLADRGMWGGADIGIQHRRVEHRTLVFDLRAGFSALAQSRDDIDETPWLTEAFVGGEALLRAPNGVAGIWAGIDVAVPIVSRPDDATILDPQTRVGFHLGGTLGMVDDLDVFVLGSILDRGDVDTPATTLPILGGGFDQTQIIFGVMKRFDLSEDEPQEELVQAR